MMGALFQSPGTGVGVGGLACLQPLFPASSSPKDRDCSASSPRAQLDFTSPFAGDASSEMLVVFVSLEVS